MDAPPPHAEDHRLVARILSGDELAREAFVQRMRCVPRILSVKNRRLGGPLSPEDLADLAQDVFSTVWKKLADYEGEAAIETWVYPFCVLLLMNAARRSARSPRALAGAEEQLSGTSNPATDVEALDHVYVHAALARLSEQESRTVTLKQFECLSFEQIAARLSVPVNTTKTRYYRGLEKLRGLLSQRFGMEGAG